MSVEFAMTYRSLLRACLERGVEEKNERTGKKIKALAAGASFTVPLMNGVLPTCGLRRTRPHVAAAENAWCLLGHDHADWMRRHTKVWDDFCDVQDCVPCDGTGQVESQPFGTMMLKCPHCDGAGKTWQLRQAYGHRWRFAFGVDQLVEAVDRLNADRSDRRVWINSWDPREDILRRGQKTVPCPVGFTLSILDGRLNSSLMIRSSDLLMGLPYDVMRHAFLMDAVAMSCLVDVGTMRVTLAHPHLYEPHWRDAHYMTTLEPVVPNFMMPKWNCVRVADQPDEYVNLVKEKAESCEWPVFNPKVEVVR